MTIYNGEQDCEEIIFMPHPRIDGNEIDRRGYELYEQIELFARGIGGQGNVEFFLDTGQHRAALKFLTKREN